jgi:hypothetical protein
MVFPFPGAKSKLQQYTAQSWSVTRTKPQGGESRRKGRTLAAPGVGCGFLVASVRWSAGTEPKGACRWRASKGEGWGRGGGDSRHGSEIERGRGRKILYAFALFVGKKARISDFSSIHGRTKIFSYRFNFDGYCLSDDFLGKIASYS